MKKGKGLATGLIIGALGIALVGAIGGLSKGFRDWNVKDWFGKGNDNPPDSTSQPEKDDEEEKEKNDNNQLQTLRLFAASAVTQNADGSVTKTITASVEPSDAPDKTVDWAVSWDDEAALKDEDIGEYLTVTPDADGSNVAKITCKKSFRGSVAYVTVTTRVGKLTAHCAVSFEGIPSSMAVDTSSIQKDGNYYRVPVGQSSLSVSLSNVFNDVGDQYLSNVSLTVSGVGKAITGTYYSNMSGSGWSTTKEIELGELKDKVFNSIKYEDNSLKFDVIRRVENCEGTTSGGSYGGTTSDKFKQYVDGSAGDGITPYWHIELKSGDATANFNFRVVSSVTNVSLAQNTIVF